MTRLQHGGELSDAAALGRRPWLDLSTGINPHAYPAVWEESAITALPQSSAEAELLAAAREAYRVPAGTELVAAPGTQALLQWLPQIIPAPTVAVLGPTYQEHAACWRRVASVREHDTFDADAAALWVVVNPNNPTGARHRPDTLAAFAQAVAKGPGRHLAEAGHPVLIVDEAFLDLAPTETLAGAPHTLVLRSFGKFYGLAGLRLGFVVGAPTPIAQLRECLGPWAVSGPALSIGRAALADRGWADTMRARLARERADLDTHLAGVGLSAVGGTDLFRLIATPQANALQRALAADGVWTRTFSHQPQWIRLGLPGPAEAELARVLAHAARAVGLR